MSDIQQALAEAIHEICGIDPAGVTREKSIARDLGIDSLDFLDVVYELDKRYGIKIPLAEWTERINTNKAAVEEYFTVGALVGHIEALVRAKQGDREHA